MGEREKWGYLFSLPYIIYLSLFFIGPVIYLIFLSFTHFNGFSAPSWVGFENWVSVLGDQKVWHAVRNTAFFAIIFVPLQTIVALILAFLMQKTTLGTTTLRVMYFLPVVTPWVAATVIFSVLLLPEVGIVSRFVAKFGLNNAQWYLSSNWMEVMGTLAVLNTWKGIGSSMVIYTSGLQGISKEVNEAAIIDGASTWERFKHITMPLISPTTYLIVVLSTISAFQVFDLVLLLAGNDKSTSIHVLNTLIYRSSFGELAFGEAAVITWVLIVVVFLLNVIYRALEKRLVHYE